LGEAFLIRMNDFDRYLEFELRQMLDPVVARKAPRRGSRKSAGSPFLAVVSASIDVVVDALPAVEPVVVPVQP
jgi:hypothetical protein